MTQLLVATAIVAVGSCLQGAVGFGVNLVASPLLLLVDDVFVPGPVIVASTVLNVLIMRREGHGSVDPAIGVAIAGQVAGAIAAGAVLASLPTRSLSLLFAGCVLAAVAVSASGINVRPTPRTLTGAGVAAGFMGTVSGIGGPPIALVYQRADGATFRATLARFFLAGSAVALLTLAVVGELGADELRASAALLPGVAIGFAASRGLVRHVEARSVRPFVLGLSAAAAVAVILREVV